MASEKLDGASSATGDEHAKKLQESLEKVDEDQKLPRRPTLILAAVISLFCSSTFGIILAGVTLARPVDIIAACISRDLILFASVVSYFYIGLHIRAARRNVYRLHPGPPQLHGEYLHATALLVSRLAICIWVAALIAVSAMVAMSAPARGMEGAVPYLNLMICIGAVPAFIVIAATIETTTVPFATACVSKPALLTCRVSDFADDVVADESVSRRASLSRAKASGKASMAPATTPAPKTAVPTPAVVKAPPVKVVVKATPAPAGITSTPITPLVTPPPTYNPGGWKNEFQSDNNASIDAVTSSTAVAMPEIALPAATAPASGPVPEAPPESVITTLSGSNYSNSGPPSSYFTYPVAPTAPENRRPRMTSQGNFGPRPLTGRTPSNVMSGGLPSPMPVVRPQDMYHGTPLPYNHVRPSGPRSFTGPLQFNRRPPSRSFSSNVSVPQPSKLSTVQYAEDIHMPTPIPSGNRYMSPPRPPKVNESATAMPQAVAMPEPAPTASLVAPAGPRPMVTTAEAPRAQNTSQLGAKTIATPMPGCLPSPYWVLRKAQQAQNNLPAPSVSGPSANQPEQVAENAPGRIAPAPYYEDVPDEGEPRR